MLEKRAKIAAFMIFNYCFTTAEKFILSLISLGIFTLVWKFLCQDLGI